MTFGARGVSTARAGAYVGALIGSYLLCGPYLPRFEDL